MSDRNTSDFAVYFHRSQVPAGLHSFDARDCGCTEEGQYVFPIVRSAITETEDDVFVLLPGSNFSPERPRGAVKELEKGLVKPPHAAEAGGGGDIRHRHLSVVNQLFREQHPPCLCNRQRGGAKMLQEEAAQLALAQTQACRQLFNTILGAIESAFGDERQGARNRIGSASPGGKVRGY